MKRKLTIALAVTFIVAILAYTVSLKYALDNDIVLGEDEQSATARPDTTFAGDMSAGLFDGFVEKINPQAIARPDTTKADDRDEDESVISLDTRPPHEAGYEDGFWTGRDDKVIYNAKETYDEGSQFPTPEEREAYKKGYGMGYSEGFKGDTTNINNKQ